MVKPRTKKPGPPKVKKSGPLKIKQTVVLKPKKMPSPAAKKTGSPAAKKTRSPAARKVGSPAAKKTVSPAAKTTSSPVAKEAGSLVMKKKSSAKFLALKKANDGRFRKRSVQRRQALKREEDVEEKRGVVVISNIPHGFFEGQMERYFRQFGVLENLRLVRSKRTGQSCGYAYVEFEHYEVAKIVAKFMDGYLTFGKIMKCKVLPPEAINNKLFRGKDIRPDNCPKLNVRKGAIRRLNKTRTDKQIQRRVARLTSTYTKKSKKLEELGVYIPLQTLIGKLPQKEEGEEAAKLTNGQTASEDKENDQTNLSFPEDASDVEPSEDINLELTEDQKGELSAKREELAAMIKSHLGSAKNTKPKKKTASKSQAAISTEKMVLEVDESEDEVVLKTPPNVIKKYVKMGSESTPKVTPKGEVLTLKGKSVTPKAKKTKMALEGKMTPKEKNTTPKAKKIKPSPQGEDVMLESTENMTPKGKKTKLSLKGETKMPKGMNTPKQKNIAEETWTATPGTECTTPGTKSAMLKLGKATPSSERKTGAKKTKIATPKATLELEGLAATPREELECVEILTTPKTKKRKLKELPADDTLGTPVFEVEEIPTTDKLATPIINSKTPKSKNKTPKVKNTPTPSVVAPQVEEVQVLEVLTTPKSKVRTPKAKKHTSKLKDSSAGDTQATPSLEILDQEEVTIMETSKMKVKTPKVKKQTPDITGTSESEDTAPSKKKTPKLKKTGHVGENKENKGDSTPKPRKTASTPTPTTIATTLENAVSLSEATPGKKKNKANDTSKTTPGGKRKQDEVASVVEATPSKKETGNRNITPKKRKQSDGTPLLATTPGQKKKTTLVTPIQTITTSPKTPKNSVTPFKTTPGKKTLKGTPGKRKSILEVLPDGKSHGKKHKGLSAT